MIVALVVGAVYLVIIVISFQQQRRPGGADRWLLAYLGFSVILFGIHALLIAQPPIVDLPLSPQILALGGLVVSTLLIGLLTISYLGLAKPLQTVWIVLTSLWAVALIIASLTNMPSLIRGQNTFLATFGAESSLSLDILVFGWLILALILFVLTARGFLAQALPMYANRMLFWAVISPVLLLGDALSAWRTIPWNYAGYAMRLIGTIGVTYAVYAHRILDVRDTVRWTISRTILTLITGAFFLGTILAAFNLPNLGLGLTERWIATAALALAAAILLIPLQRLFTWLLRWIAQRERTDPAEAVRLYSQRIAGQLDLRDLASTAIKTTNELFGTRRGLLILATPDDESVVLEAVGAERNQVSEGRISIESPLYKHFLGTSRPVIQYDVDYDNAFAAVSQNERHYLSSLDMDIYAPIVGDGKLIGMLALGPKGSDASYQPSDSQLLMAMANQTVAALENARLVTDLRNLNREISSLNQDLRATNQRLEQLDAVKSDFISIASHELRTPLTQMQGYADLLMEMSERNLLSPDQTIEIMTSLRRASQRMGEVISSMLDVSQIDVENMDLNFVETSLASIVKLAIEPYGEAIHSRNLTLVARGLRNLPPIYADYKRLVQAFDNLITNAIKFTSDGGKINVTGEIFEKIPTASPRVCALP